MEMSTRTPWSDVETDSEELESHMELRLFTVKQLGGKRHTTTTAITIK